VRQKADYRRRDRRDAAFPDALDPQRVERRRRFLMDDIDVGHFRRAHQQIFRHIGGERLAVFVVLHPLEQGVADTVRGAAMDLAVDDHRIDNTAAVVGDDEIDHGYAAGLHVDFHLHHGAAAGIGHLIDNQMLGRLHAGLDTAGQRIARRPRHRMSDLPERHRHVGHALDSDAVALDFEIGFRRLQHVRRHLERLVAHLHRRHMSRRSRHHRKPAVRRADAERGRGGVAHGHGDIVHIAAELLADNLRQHGAGALADGGAAAINMHLAGRADAHGDLFERAAAGALDEIGDPDPDIAPLCARRLLTGLEPVTIGPVERRLLAFRKIAAVEQNRHAATGFQRHLVGHLVGRDQIAPPHLGGIEAEFARHPVHQPFAYECRLRMPGAAHRCNRDLVGQGEADIHAVGRHLVLKRQAFRRVVGDVHAARGVGAVLMDHGAADAEDTPVVIDRDFGIPVLIALHGGGDEMLAPVLDPFDRPVQHDGGQGYCYILGIDHQLGAEAAADIGGDDANLIFVAAQHIDENPQRRMWHLGRAPQGKTIACGIVDCDAAAAFD